MRGAASSEQEYPARLKIFAEHCGKSSSARKRGFVVLGSPGRRTDRISKQVELRLEQVVLLQRNQRSGTAMVLSQLRLTAGAISRLKASDCRSLRPDGRLLGGVLGHSAIPGDRWRSLPLRGVRQGVMEGYLERCSRPCPGRGNPEYRAGFCSRLNRIGNMELYRN